MDRRIFWFLVIVIIGHSERIHRGCGEIEGVDEGGAGDAGRSESVHRGDA